VKRLCILLLSLLLLMSLWACAPIPEYTVELDQKTYTVNTQNKTISDGTYTYRYEYSGTKQSYTFTVNYPNRIVYTITGNNGIASIAGSDSLDGTPYPSVGILHSILTDKKPQHFNPAKWLGVLFAIGCGAFVTANPEVIWYWTNGWKFQNAQPSELALTTTTISGIFMIIGGILMIFMT
jgi:hypothetical protein